MRVSHQIRKLQFQTMLPRIMLQHTSTHWLKCFTVISFFQYGFEVFVIFCTCARLFLLFLSTSIIYLIHVVYILALGFVKILTRKKKEKQCNDDLNYKWP